ncbi:MAG TPA: hypothetical protein VFT82_00165, partial [Candidatus Paceibacterota bacterium]|nr:hypothetical protein [Candidatus Paceibacterota bacterium]
MISADPKILEEGSQVRSRMKEYGQLFKELHIVVTTVGGKEGPVRIAENVTAYPTASRSKL